MNNKRILVITVLVVILFTISELSITYANNMPKRIFDVGIGYMGSREYILAKESFQKVLERDSNHEESKKLIGVIDNYLASEALAKEKRFEEALSTIDLIDVIYENYSIKSDVETLKTNIKEEIKLVEINNKVEAIVLALDNKDYEKAKAYIIELKKEELTEEQSNKVAEIEQRIETELAEIEAEIAKEKAKEAELNSSSYKISKTSVAGYSEQIIGVVSDGGSYANLVRWEKNSDGSWREIDSTPARIGQNGMASPSVIYEMDKRTPTGVYSLTEAFGINSNPGSGLPYRIVNDNDYWVDDEESQYYNQWMEGPVNGRWNSAEHLASYSGHYNYSVVIDYNRWPVIPGKSSAIFLHCEMGVATYGCIAISESQMINILNWLNPSKNPQIIIAQSWNELYGY